MQGISACYQCGKGIGAAESAAIKCILIRSATATTIYGDRAIVIAKAGRVHYTAAYSKRCRFSKRNNSISDTSVTILNMQCVYTSRQVTKQACSAKRTCIQCIHVGKCSSAACY